MGNWQDEKAKARTIEKFLGVPKVSKLPKLKGRETDMDFIADAARYGPLDPDDYPHARKKLRKAIVEQYRSAHFFTSTCPSSCCSQRLGGLAQLSGKLLFKCLAIELTLRRS